MSPTLPSVAPASDFDDVYRRAGAPLYGVEPVPELRSLLESGLVAAPGRVLDLGCGDGRNALYVARRGFEVEAVDTAASAIARLQAAAQRENLAIAARVDDVRTLSYPPGRYGLIVANTILDHLERSADDWLVPLITRALAPGGVLFASVFTTRDPGCTGVGRPSATARFVRHYYEPGELARLFAGLTVVRYVEQHLVDKAHGRPHRHQIARLTARKPPERRRRRLSLGRQESR